jgi:hypothetical protein
VIGKSSGGWRNCREIYTGLLLDAITGPKVSQPFTRRRGRAANKYFENVNMEGNDLPSKPSMCIYLARQEIAGWRMI